MNGDVSADTSPFIGVPAERQEQCTWFPSDCPCLTLHYNRTLIAAQLSLMTARFCRVVEPLHCIAAQSCRIAEPFHRMDEMRWLLRFLELESWISCAKP
jgi:hypothetical protein